MCIVFFQAFDPPSAAAAAAAAAAGGGDGDDDLSPADREIARRYALVLASNRDEYLTRPTKRAHVWAQEEEGEEEEGTTKEVVLAGRDLMGGGTWLGVTKSGRVSVLTNYRTPGDDAAAAGGGAVAAAPATVEGKGKKRSRGQLVLGYLRNDSGGGRPLEYAEKVVTEASVFAGFNLMVGDIKAILQPLPSSPSAAFPPPPPASFVYVSNKAAPPVRPLSHNRLYAMANRLLDTPWEKLTRGKGLFRDCVAQAAAVLLLAGKEEKGEDDGGDVDDVDDAVAHLFLRGLLADGHACAPATDTGYGVDVEGKLNRICIPGVCLWEGSPLFGTSTQTVLLVRRDGRVLLYERALLPGGPGPGPSARDAGRGEWRWSEAERLEVQVE